MAQLIDSKIIDDSYLNEECSMDEAFVYYQAIIRANKSGIYPYTLKTSALWGKVTVERLKEILEKFRDDDKLFYSNGWIAVNGHSDKYNYSNPNHALSALKELAAIPENILDNDLKIRQIYEKLAHKLVPIAMASDKHRDAIPMAFKNYNNAIPMPLNNNNDGIKQENNAISHAGARTNPNPNPNPYSNPSPPSPPKGRPAPDPQVWIKDPVTGETVRNPALEGRKEGKGNDQSLGKGRKEGKEGKLDVNHPDAIMKWSQRIAMKNSDVDRLEEEFGKDITWDAIDKADDWAEEKGIEVKDSYKFVRGFAAKEVANG